MKRLIGEIVDIVTAKMDQGTRKYWSSRKKPSFYLQETKTRSIRNAELFSSLFGWSKSDLSRETAILNSFMQQALEGMLS